MNALKIFVLSVLFILSIGLFSTPNVFADNPPRTYSVFVQENGKTVEYIYEVTDGGVVLINVRNYD